jgi:hypothetical protein
MQVDASDHTFVHKRMHTHAQAGEAILLTSEPEATPKCIPDFESCGALWAGIDAIGAAPDTAFRGRSTRRILVDFHRQWTGKPRSCAARCCMRVVRPAAKTSGSLAPACQRPTLRLTDNPHPTVVLLLIAAKPSDAVLPLLIPEVAALNSAVRDVTKRSVVLSAVWHVVAG